MAKRRQVKELGPVEVLGDERFEVAESPYWDRESASLVWVDIPLGRVHVLDQNLTRSTIEVGQPVGAIAPRRNGGLVMAVRDGFAIFEVETTGPEIVAFVGAGDPTTRMNDGACDAMGRFWAGTMADDMAPGKGALYRLGSDFEVTEVLRDVSVSNGICWDDEEGVMFYVDSGTGRVDVFNYDSETGDIHHRRPVVEIPGQLGLPDGIALDVEGFLWVAIWGGSCVRRYQRDGSLDAVVNLPTAQITSCAFGGKDLSELYITSARAGLSAADQRRDPLAGAIFHLRLEVAGFPTNSFVG